MRPLALLKLALGLSLAALASLGAAPSARANDASPVNVIFVIDGSGSMEFTDPGAFRRDAVKAFIDLVAEDVGGVAITQFAGWSETGARGDVVFPLTKLPAGGADLEKVLDGAKKAIDEKVQPFGEATDFNRALAEGIRPALEQVEKDGKKAWVIFFTDGDSFEVPEAAQTRDVYLAAAKAKGGDAGPEALNAIALEEFVSKTVPGLKKDSIFVTPILLQSTSEESELSPVLDALVKGTNGPGRALRVTAQSLRTVFLEALASVPTSFLSSRATKGFGYKAEQARPKAPAEMTFRRYPFATMTRAIIFSESPALEVDVLGPDGKSVKGTPGVRVVGDGSRYRIVSLGKRTATGNYKASIVSGADRPVTIEHIWYATIDARPKIELPPDSEPGTPVFGKISLLGPDGGVIQDAQFIEDLQAEIWMKTPKGEKREVAPPRFTRQASEAVEIALGQDVALGTYEVFVKFRALKREGGDYAYESEVASAKTEVRSKVEVVVSPTEAREGGTASTLVKLLAGRATPKGLAVTLTDPAGGKHPVALSREGVAKEMAGAPVLLDRGGDWTVAAACEDPVKIDVRTPVVHVSGRSLELFATTTTGAVAAPATPTGAPLEKVVIALPWEEAGQARAMCFARVDATPDETPKFSFVLGGGAGKGPGAGGKGIVAQALPAPASMGPASFVLVSADQAADGDLTGDWKLKGEAVIGKVKVERTWPVEVTYPDKEAKERAKLLKLLLLIGLPLLLLVLLVLLWLFMRARFDRHKLVLVGEDRQVKAQHLLAEKVGVRGGTGPPEVPGAMAIAALGRRGKTRARLGPADAKSLPLWRNGKPLAAGEELVDGDRITFEKDGKMYTYLYFSGEVPKDISKFLPPPKVEDDEIVIEF